MGIESNRNILLSKTASALVRTTPNLGTPRNMRRNLLMGVIRATALRTASLWPWAMRYKTYRRERQSPLTVDLPLEWFLHSVLSSQLWPLWLQELCPYTSETEPSQLNTSAMVHFQKGKIENAGETPEHVFFIYSRYSDQLKSQRWAVKSQITPSNIVGLKVASVGKWNLVSTFIKTVLLRHWVWFIYE